MKLAKPRLTIVSCIVLTLICIIGYHVSDAAASSRTEAKLQELTKEAEKLEAEKQNILQERQKVELERVNQKLDEFDYENCTTDECLDELKRLTEKRDRLIAETGQDTNDHVKAYVERMCIPEIVQEYDFIKQIAKANRIKHEMLIAVMYADSQCGRAMSTANNPGNVGNNDRGDRIHLDTMRDGIHAIATTLNNKYHFSKTMVGELSCGGRAKLGMSLCGTRGTSIYASSQENWNRNVIGSLTDMGIEASESWVFRD